MGQSGSQIANGNTEPVMVGSATFDNIWVKYDKTRTALPVKEAKKFLRQLAKVADVDLNEEQIDSLINELDSEKTGILTYRAFKSLLMSTTEKTGIPVTKSMLERTSRRFVTKRPVVPNEPLTPSKAGTPVLLNVYDLWDLQKVNSCTLHFGFGAFHCGVEVFGQEYSFGYPDGLYSIEPRQATIGKFRNFTAIGETKLTFLQVRQVLAVLGKEFTGESYDIISNNCNHFCDAFCQKLVQNGIPRSINKLASFAKHFQSEKGNSQGNSESVGNETVSEKKSLKRSNSRKKENEKGEKDKKSKIKNESKLERSLSLSSVDKYAIEKLGNLRKRAQSHAQKPTVGPQPQAQPHPQPQPREVDQQPLNKSNEQIEAVEFLQMLSRVELPAPNHPSSSTSSTSTASPISTTGIPTVIDVNPTSTTNPIPIPTSAGISNGTNQKPIKGSSSSGSSFRMKLKKSNTGGIPPMTKSKSSDSIFAGKLVKKSKSQKSSDNLVISAPVLVGTNPPIPKQDPPPQKVQIQEQPNLHLNLQQTQPASDSSSDSKISPKYSLQPKADAQQRRKAYQSSRQSSTKGVSFAFPVVASSTTFYPTKSVANLTTKHRRVSPSSSQVQTLDSSVTISEIGIPPSAPTSATGGLHIVTSTSQSQFFSIASTTSISFVDAPSEHEISESISEIPANNTTMPKPRAFNSVKNNPTAVLRRSRSLQALPISEDLKLPDMQSLPKANGSTSRIPALSAQQPPKSPRSLTRINSASRLREPMSSTSSTVAVESPREFVSENSGISPREVKPESEPKPTIQPQDQKIHEHMVQKLPQVNQIVLQKSESQPVQSPRQNQVLSPRQNQTQIPLHVVVQNQVQSPRLNPVQLPLQSFVQNQVLSPRQNQVLSPRQNQVQIPPQNAVQNPVPSTQVQNSAPQNPVLSPRNPVQLPLQSSVQNQVNLPPQKIQKFQYVPPKHQPVQLPRNLPDNSPQVSNFGDSDENATISPRSSDTKAQSLNKLFTNQQMWTSNAYKISVHGSTGSRGPATSVSNMNNILSTTDARFSRKS